MVKLTRRRFLAGLGGLGGLSVCGGLYTRFGEPDWLELDRVVVDLDSRAPAASLRVLHLSDLHVADATGIERAERAMAMGLEQQPDVVCLTGDFVRWQLFEPERYRDILRMASAAAPTFACLGNHDGGNWARWSGYADTVEVRGLLARSDVRVLVNESNRLTIAGADLEIAGLGDLWAESIAPERVLETKPSPDRPPLLVLCHNPDSKDLLRRFDWDLMLCGHTHGGQLKLPLLGTPFAPVRDHRYVEGLHPWAGRWIYITRGVGNLHELRFNCRPQVSLIELQGKHTPQSPATRA